MIEIEDLLVQTRKKHSTDKVSLFGKLEAIIGGYFLSEVTDGIFGGLWNTVYFDQNVKDGLGEVKCSSENIIGYVDREERWAIILDKNMKKFKEDTREYGMQYIGVPSLQQKVLQCSHTDNLPGEFSGILWIDDDFMNDPNIPFDHESFLMMDTGERYLNPRHFSADELIRFTQQVSRNGGRYL